jgi:glycosyltransferase involved in cell wall biosynthesis
MLPHSRLEGLVQALLAHDIRRIIGNDLGVDRLKIFVVHEVNYLSKIIYEFQILPEMLSMLGHDVTVIDYNDSWDRDRVGSRINLRTTVHAEVHRAYPAASVTVRRPGMIAAPILSRLSGAITNGLEVLRAVRKEKPDVILLYGLPTVGIQALVAARAYGVPIVFRSIDVTHTLVPFSLLVPATKVLETLVFRLVDFNIALTPHLKKYILSYGVADSRVRLLPSGVDTEMFSPGLRDDALLSKWGIAADDKLILFMGTIYRFSGLDKVILDYPKVLRHQPRAKLLIVGIGEDEVRLRRLAADVGVTDHVIFTGLMPYASLPSLIQASDICINPFELNPITENILPTKLFQYMTCEKPVLATPLPGTQTFLAGEEHGIVYASLEHFNQELIDLLSDPMRCRQLGRSARKAAQLYDWKEIARTMASWLAEVA